MRIGRLRMRLRTNAVVRYGRPGARLRGGLLHLLQPTAAKGASLFYVLSNKLVASAIVAAIGVGAAVPAAQAATTTTTTKRTSVYHISVNPGVLAGARLVRAKVVVTNPQASVRDWYSRATIQKVVRKGVNNGIQKTYRSQGYRCVPRSTAA